MGEAIQAIKAADNGVKAITSLIENLRGVITQARSEASGATAAQVTQFSSLTSQIDSLANDSNYQGTNFLKSGSLTVNFNETATSSLTVTGFDSTSSGLSVSSLSAGASGSALDTVETSLNTALTTLRTQSASLSSNLSVIQTRQDFTTNMVNTLTEGANKLTAADTNEEGANMLMLQTRNQLGTTALSLASQAAQSVLRLF
jgi:flagellin-like hook-associated protein FlgL